MLPLLLLLGCQSATPEAVAEASAPALAPVVAATWTPEVEITGSLEPIAAVQLGFEVGGRLEALLVARGQAVEQGQPLARLDADVAAAQLAQAEAAVAAAEAQLAAGEPAFERAKALYDSRGLSEQQYQEAQAGIAAGRAGVEQARAAARLARINLGFHTLRSPIAGVVTAGPDSPGMVVGPGTPLFHIQDLSSLQLKGTAPESAIWLREGLSATVIVGGVEVPATVARVLPALDPQTRRLPVELRIDSPGEAAKAWSFARARIRAGEAQPAWQVPATAIAARPDFVVFAVGAGGTPARVPVTVLREEGTTALVQGALHDGDQVLAAPPASLGAE